MCAVLRARRWFGTLFEPTSDQLAAIALQPVVYGLIGQHIGQRSCRIHTHVLLAYANPRVRPTFIPGMHWDPAPGDYTSIRSYCDKDDDIYEWGATPSGRKGLQDAWNHFVDTIKAGEVDKDSQFLKNYEGELAHKNIWLVGPTGCGKSRMAHEAFPPEEKCVLIEDADPTMCKFIAHYFKIWCDRYPFIAEKKGGAIAVNASDYNLVVTSQYTIDECFPEERDAEAIRRRFDVFEFKEEDSLSFTWKSVTLD
ncbi:hypothetical protein CL6EHI_145480 [Entamoeba histolytica]|uniref:Replication-associated protein n=3 Tax=Entamoeba histolytica TaxID=5759 RepID=C4M6F1_ENTH1|nr:hypothetical protein EHI_145480 [Entamoeba histolytica HM-1:IMSS]EAL47419.2 hypothetical protein EHI_145480 [Entamoeba histolytica HM-1:IMSS]EMD43578.1 replication-associated protein, putative [Entamoeba histolytica KU27]GAT97058.1 hypothetical protein CL6EHI_145480 [Entamoeba histolytica]|eukprot:XP_652805.2 hypothetical protein EHI_145480 [Entamoeba histolytica HM-1:IMSS]